MQRIGLIIEYRGTNYCGWQVQPNQKSIQGVLEDALEQVLKKRTTLFGSGRTDKGVHAFGQVAHFDYEGRLPFESIPSALNNILPSDISILRAFVAEQDFHARYSAKQKTYLYKLYISPVRRATLWDTHYVIRDSLDIQNMLRCADVLIGEHDFKAFCSTGSNPKTTVRKLYEINIKVGNEKLALCDNLSIGLENIDKTQKNVNIECFNHVDESVLKTKNIVCSGEVILSFTANSFLYNMVRVITAQLIKAGKGELNAIKMKNILLGLDRSKAKESAPPSGLYLKEVLY